MLGLLLILQLAVSSTRPDSSYASPALRVFIEAAAEANRAPPASLRGYRARVESELSLLIRDTLGRERTAQVEQIAMNANWQRGYDYALRVVGYRSQTVGVPYSALSFARSWTIPYLYGDRLTLGVDFARTDDQRRKRDSSDTTAAQRKRGRAADTLHAVHPLASDRDRYYRFSGGDTIAVLRTRERAIPIVRVHVQAMLDSAPPGSRIAAFAGEIDFDATRHQIVRMRGQFVATAARGNRLSVARIPGLVAVAYVELVNAEVDGQYWLPAFQRSEFQAAFAPLGANRSIFRLVSHFAEFEIGRQLASDSSVADSAVVRLATRDDAVTYRRRLSFAPADSVSAYRGWLQALGIATSNVSGSDFDDLAPDVWRATGPPRFEFAPTKLEEMFRFNRVEGAYTGFAVSERFRDAFPGLTAHAYGGWAWSEKTPRGGLSAAYRSRSLTTTARVERTLASTNDFTAPLENGTEGFGALVGIDDQDYVDRRLAAVSLTRIVGSTRGALIIVEGGVGEDRPERARLSQSPFDIGNFRFNRASIAGQYVRGAATIELHPDVTGIFLEPGIGLIASYEVGQGQIAWQRAEVTIAARKNFSDFVISTRAQGGLVSGRTLPPQQLLELGGENALPGYEYKAFAGDRAAAAGVLTSYTFPVLRRPFRVVGSLFLPGLSPGLAAGIQGGWTEASSEAARVAIQQLDPSAPPDCVTLNVCPVPLSIPTNGVRATVDARVTFFGGLVGIGVARAIDHAAPWRLAFRFSQEY